MTDAVVVAVVALVAAAVAAVVAARAVHASSRAQALRLAEAARRVASGELAHRVQPEGGPGWRELGDAFNAMTDHLAQHVEALRRSRTDFRRALDRLGDALAAAHDLPAIVDVVLETSALTLGADEAVLWRASSARDPLQRGAAFGTTTEGRLAPGDGVAGAAAVTDAGVVWPDPIAAGAPPGAGEPPAYTAMAFPVHSSGGLFGILAVYARSPRPPYDEDDLATFHALVRQAETAIDNVFLHEEAQRLSITDGLTGVWNRRLFDLRAAEAVQRATRFGEPFTVVLLDIDDFKVVNDTYGHQAGDAVLVELAARLARATREVDLVSRWGGEEFALLLPMTEVAGAITLAEKVRQSVAATPFEVDGEDVPVTVSVGFATHPTHGATMASLIEAADESLYRSKAAGKNRVTWPEAERVQEGSGR